MTTILAAVLSITLGQFALTAGTFIVGIPVSLALSWLSDITRTTIVGFLSGCGAVFTVMLYVALVFRLLVGPKSFGLLAFVCAVLSLIIPVYNDYQKYRQVKAAHDTLTATIGQELDAPLIRAHATTVLGELSGIALTGAYLLV